jgi:Tol biopolymer transport system component
MAVRIDDGGEPENLSRTADDDYSPAWSPDGAVIAFTRNAEIWLMGSDGSDQAPLVAGLWPAWRP